MKRTLLFIACVLASVTMQALVPRVSNLEYAHATGRHFMPGESNPDVTNNPLYGEWWLVGWNEGGATFEVDTNYVCHKHLSIEFSEEDYVKAYSMVNEIFLGKLTLNGNEMIFEGGGMTKVYGNVMENLFFEDRIFGIKSYQLDGNLLRLYYTDNDYFVFTSDIIDSDEYYFEWKNGLVDPYIGEVTAINVEEVDVKVIHSPSIATFYSRTMPPTGNNDICHFAKSDLAGLSFNVGDKVAFRITQFKRLKVEKGREYQLKVEPCSGTEHVTDRTGTMHNDRRMGWIIIDNEVDKQEGGIYYYPLKVLSEAYLIEGLPVTFSGELFPTWRMPWDNEGNSDCYYMSIDAIAIDIDNSYYIPFVKEGKTWNVFRSDYDTGIHLEQYTFPMNEKVVDPETGRTYFMMYQKEDDSAPVFLGGLREENRKVYFIGPDAINDTKEYLLFDYSLKAGDTYWAHSDGEGKMVSYKVISVDDYQEGPEVIRYDYDEEGSLITHRRYLKKWTVCRTDYESFQMTWIEGVGSLEGPLGNLHDVVLPGMTKDYLGYVEYLDYDFIYLPFSFCDTFNRLVYGCTLPMGEADHSWVFQHQLTYELQGDRLHVYGKAYTQCSPNYAYFIEKPTDDPLVHKIEFGIQEVEPLVNCMALHVTDFYVPGFDPNLNYIVVDNQGEEHPVINKTVQMAYRPFVEDGKVWKVGPTWSGNPVQWVEHFYFDGDTIISGRTCKQMMNQRYVSPDYPHYYNSQSPSLRYVGAWYEEDKKVYEYDAASQQFKLMYDFSVEANDTLQINDQSYVIGPRQTGGLTGFKGVYRKVALLEDGWQIYSPEWLEGVGSTDSPTNNVYTGYVDPARFLMSCTVGDEVIYLLDRVEDGASPDALNARKRIDFTHTIKTKPKMPRRSMGVRASLPAEDGQSLYGEYNNLKLDINLNPLADAYLVRITDESGKAVYEKNVNAASIVGLNIDISAYAEGRYTVTVENSQESFTGVFETVTTGISDALHLNDNGEMTNNHIYNLQGQRISTLRKGLNIVNGQKVSVK